MPTLRWPYPVVFLEHKLLYGEKQDPADYAELPGGDDIASHLFPTLRRGAHEPDVTLVTYGGMLPLVESGGARLEDEEELAVEIVALSLLAPLPRGTLIGHLLDAPPRRRGRGIAPRVRRRRGNRRLHAGARLHGTAAAHRRAAGADRLGAQPRAAACCPTRNPIVEQFWHCSDRRHGRSAYTFPA